MIEQSAEKIAKQIRNRIELLIVQAVPLPTCPRAKAKAEWKRDEVRRILNEKLNEANNKTD